MVIRNPGIATVANPVDTYAAPEQSNRFIQLAASLRDLNPALTSVLRPIADRWVENQFDEGRKRAIEDARDWRDAVQRNDRRLGENPWFRRAYRQQMGRQAGQQIYQEAVAAYQNWEGRDSDNPEDFRFWVGNFIGERTRDIQQRDIIEGLLPELNTLQNNLSIMHAAYTAERVEQEGNDAINNAVVGALRNARNGPLDLTTGNVLGDFDPAIMLEQYEELRDRFNATGISRTRFDEVFARSVMDAAVNDLDEAYLEILEQPRSDGTPPISRKAGMSDRINDARTLIESRTATRAARQAAQEEAQRDAAARALYIATASEILANGELSAETRRAVAQAGVQGLIDMREFANMQQALRQGLDAMDDPLLQQGDRDMDPDLLLDVYDRGDVRAVIEAWNTGQIVDPAYFRTLVQAAVSRREQEQDDTRQDVSTDARMRSDAAAASNAMASAKAYMVSVIQGQPGRPPLRTDANDEPITEDQVDMIVEGYMAGQISAADIDRRFGPGTSNRLDAAIVRARRE